jgi:hypothetical protein
MDLKGDLGLSLTIWQDHQSIPAGFFFSADISYSIPAGFFFLPIFRTPYRQDLFSGQDFEKKEGF